MTYMLIYMDDVWTVIDIVCCLLYSSWFEYEYGPCLLLDFARGLALNIVYARGGYGEYSYDSGDDVDEGHDADDDVRLSAQGAQFRFCSMVEGDDDGDG